MLPPKEFAIKKDKLKPIKKVSDKMRKELSKYQKLKIAFLVLHSDCEAKLKDCTFNATEVHHKAKRGANLNEAGTWLAVCRTCHTQIENMPLCEAIKLGLRCQRLA